MEGIFAKTPTPLWKFQIMYISLNILALQYPHPPGNSNPFCGGSTKTMKSPDIT